MVGMFWFKCNKCDCKNFTSGGSANDMPKDWNDPEEWRYSIWFDCADCEERVFMVSANKGGKVVISTDNLSR